METVQFKDLMEKLEIGYWEIFAISSSSQVTVRIFKKGSYIDDTGRLELVNVEYDFSGDV